MYTGTWSNKKISSASVVVCYDTGTGFKCATNKYHRMQMNVLKPNKNFNKENKSKSSRSLFGTRIRRIPHFLGLPDPGPLLFVRIQIRQSNLLKVLNTE